MTFLDRSEPMTELRDTPQERHRTPSVRELQKCAWHPLHQPSFGTKHNKARSGTGHKNVIWRATCPSITDLAVLTKHLGEIQKSVYVNDTLPIFMNTEKTKLNCPK